MNASIISDRLRNQKLSSAAFQQPADVVRWFCAVQAQDFRAAKWALGLRMRSATNANVEEAFNRGEILRTHLLRPTWHFVAPEDIRWLLAFTGPRVNMRCGSYFRQFELDETVFKRSNRALANALKGGKYRTRPELKGVLNRSGVAADDNMRLTAILFRAELDGVVCSGPRRDKQFTYALLEERAPAGKKLSGDEALAELTQRYFVSHGPATLQDFVWWSGLTMNDARRGIEILDCQFKQTLIDTIPYWRLNSRKRDGNPLRGRLEARLLPAFDEYNVAYKNRAVVLDPKVASLVTNWDALGPTITLNGQIVGTWKAQLNSSSLKIDLNLLRALSKSESSAIAAAAEKYADFLGLQFRASP